MSAEFRIMVRVDASGAVSGAKSVEQALDRANKRAMDLNRTLRHLFGIYIIREAIDWFNKYADGFTTLQNRLRSVTKDQSNLLGMTKATLKVANDTRTSWDMTAMMYARMARNSKELGYSQKELLGFTRSLNQAVIVGGATSAEAGAGLVQLSQGLASGALRGDELRSVLEQLPVVADVIAKHLGVTRGQLRQLGTDGKISARDVIEAFKKAAPELEKEFGKTIPTIAQSMTVLKNEMMNFFGGAGTESGLLGGMSKAIMFVAENFQTFGRTILVVGQLLGIWFAGFVIGKILLALRALALAAAANPFTAFLYVLAAIILALRQWGEEMDAGQQKMHSAASTGLKVADVLRTLWEDIKKLATAVKDFLGEAWDALTSAFNDGLDSTGIELTFKNVLLFVANFVDTCVSIFRMFKEEGGTIFKELGILIASALIDGFNAGIRALNSFINKASIATHDALSKTGSKMGTAGVEARADYDKFLASQGGMSGYFQKVGDEMGLGQYAARPGTKTATVEEVTREVQRRLRAQQALFYASAYKKEGLDAEGHALGADGKPYSGGWNFDQIENPLSNRADESSAYLRDMRKRMIADASNGSAKKYVEDVFNRSDIRGPGDQGTVSDQRGKFQKAPPTAAEERAAAKLQRELDALRKRANPIVEAQMNLAKGNDIVSRSVAAGLINWNEGRNILVDYEETLKEALDPMGHMVTAILDETAAMRGSREENEHATRLLKLRNELTEKGIDVTDVEINQIDRLVRQQEERKKVWEAEQDMLEKIKKPHDEYISRLKAIENLRKEGKITSIQGINAHREANDAFTKSNDSAYQEFQARQDKGRSPLKTGARDAFREFFDETKMVKDATTELFTKAFENMEKFIDTAAQTGKLDWDMMIDGMISSLNKLAMKILETWATMRIIGMVGGGQASVFGTGATQAFSGMFGGKYAAGGSWTAPNTGGGHDSIPVTFRVSPNERVDFTPNGGVVGYRGGGGGNQFAGALTNGAVSGGRGRVGGTAARGVQVHNHFDNRRELLTALDGPEGDQKMLNFVRRNPGAIRALLGKS